MASNAELYETIKATVVAHTEGYSTPRPFHNDTIQQYRTPDCVHNLHPRESIPAPFNQPIDQTMFAGFMDFFGNCLNRFELDIKDLVIDTHNCTAVARIDALFDFKAFAEEPAVSGYTAQYMWLMEMNGDGSKVKRVEEFLDPDRLMNYVQERAQRYAEWTKFEAQT